MKALITRTICELINGDRKVSNARIVTTDIDALRAQILKSTFNCKTVRFTYEELAD